MDAGKNRRHGKLPKFTVEGLLPPGDYELTLDELRESFLVLGPDDPAQCLNWDAAWRLKLVENAAVLIRQLWQVGISEVFQFTIEVTVDVVGTILVFDEGTVEKNLADSHLPQLSNQDRRVLQELESPRRVPIRTSRRIIWSKNQK